jgi:hypothetical protein
MPFISNGTTILDNGAFSVSLGSKVLLSTATASASASLSFNSTYINGDYQIYKFEFSSIHPRTDNVDFRFNLSTDSGSNYNVTKTTTFFTALMGEANVFGGFAYEASRDLAQSTGVQILSSTGGSDADQTSSGTLTLFNPSSTTYVKHFISRFNNSTFDNYTWDSHIAGYGNTTSAINAIQFTMSSGNFDGTIKLYGIKDS